jgi:hypothetical protein
MRYFKAVRAIVAAPIPWYGPFFVDSLVVEIPAGIGLVLWPAYWYAMLAFDILTNDGGMFFPIAPNNLTLWQHVLYFLSGLSYWHWSGWGFVLGYGTLMSVLGGFEMFCLFERALWPFKSDQLLAVTAAQLFIIYLLLMINGILVPFYTGSDTPGVPLAQVQDCPNIFEESQKPDGGDPLRPCRDLWKRGC